MRLLVIRYSRISCRARNVTTRSSASRFCSISSRSRRGVALLRRHVWRLAPAVVIAANEGFLPGRVNFAMRSDSDVNLLEWVRSLLFSPPPSAEYANGHPRATGGSLSVEDFGRLVEVLRTRAGAFAAIRSSGEGRG
jgi:hypothetical protein